MTRTLAELTDVEEPAWPDIEALAAASGARVLPVDPVTGGEVLLRLQVTAVLEGALGDAFASLRWPGWEAEVAALASDEGLSGYPLPCSSEGADIGAASRRAVPLAELHALYADVAAQVDG